MSRLIKFIQLFTLIMTVARCQGENVSPVNKEHCYCLEQVANKLYGPTVAQFTNDKDGKELMLIVEQRGTIKSIVDGKANIFMDIRDRVYITNKTGDSRGLKSAVLSPKFHHDGRIYVYYTRQADGKDFAYVSQFRTSDGKVDPSTELFLLRIYQPYEHGNGGPMLFGDDGFLYIMVGDGGADDDNLGHGQNKGSFHGSVLRIDPEGGQDFTVGESGVAMTYAVPENNPFQNEPGTRQEVFAFGFRDPWGCSVDSAKLGGDGRIYCVDPGTTHFDEVDIIEKGKNYGWNLKEGTFCRNVSTCGNIENEGKPIHVYQHTQNHALVGGFVYRGSNLGWMKGKALYTFADILTGETYYLEEKNKTANEWEVSDWARCDVKQCPAEATEPPLSHVYGIAQDTEGELYFLMVNEMNALKPEGKMFKLKEPNSSGTMLKAPSMLQSISVALSVLVFSITFRQKQ